MRIFYSNEPTGMVAIVGEIGQEALTVDGMGYHATQEALDAELRDIAAEFNITEPPVRFATSKELEAAYACPIS